MYVTAVPLYFHDLFRRFRSFDTGPVLRNIYACRLIWLVRHNDRSLSLSALACYFWPAYRSRTLTIPLPVQLQSNLPLYHRIQSSLRNGCVCRQLVLLPSTIASRLDSPYNACAAADTPISTETWPTFLVDHSFFRSVVANVRPLRESFHHGLCAGRCGCRSCEFMSAEGEFTSTNDVFMSTNDDNLSFHKELNPGNGKLPLAGDEFTLYREFLRQTRCSFVYFVYFYK